MSGSDARFVADRSAGTSRPSNGQGRVGARPSACTPAIASAHGPNGGRLSLSIARPVTITAPRRRDSGRSWRTSVDLPTPASPMTSRVCGPPCTLWSSAITSDRSSLERPTKRLNTSCGVVSFAAPATTTLSRPSRFASNSARSAAVNKASKDSPCSGAVATPTDSVTDIVRSGSSRNGIASAAVVRRTSSAMAPAPEESSPGSSTTNSSPAYRPTY